MKIILVGTAYPLRGGIAHYLALLYRHLGKRHDVEIVTFTRQYPKLLFPGKTQKEKGGENVAVPATQLIDSLNPLSWIRTARFIVGRKPDLVVFKYWMPFFAPCFGVIARLVHRWSEARVVFICDNVLPHEGHPGDRLLTTFAFRAIDFFIVQSRSVERDLLDFWPSARYRLVPHPIYEVFGRPASKAKARRRLGLPQIGRIILFFGYIRSYKGLMTLIDAMPAILQTIELTLLVVGEFYDDEQKYRDRIEALKIGDALRLVNNYIPNDRVADYFNASDAVVLPYRSATQSGIVQIAYRFDKPVIATDVGGLAEVVLDGKTGLIVPPENPAALASAVVRLYRERKEATFVRNIRKEKRKYSWDVLVKALEKTPARIAPDKL